MNSRERVFACLAHKPFDRIPIKHLGVIEIENQLSRYFNVASHDELLDRVGDDFREIEPAYCGPQLEGTHIDEHGIYASVVWRRAIQQSSPEFMEYLKKMADVPEIDEFVSGSRALAPLGRVESISELDNYQFPSTDWFDYSTISTKCEKYPDHIRMFGYCDMDFIAGISFVRSFEQTIMDIATKSPVYLELVERRFKFMYEHLKKALKAAGDKIDFVHIAEDLGTQERLLISPETFDELYADKYRAYINLAHSYGAKTMMHICGSIRKLIPRLIDLGLDVLDVVQTNAADMNLEDLKKDAGDKLAFAGTMCVQEVLPFESPARVREEVQKRLEIFRDGGLIIGPSHQLQADTPLENILEMYRAAGGLKED